MESDRSELKSKEKEDLKREKENNPDLFPQKTWVDDDLTLETLGIHIPHKKELPEAYLKLMPSDFIVEEVPLNGQRTNISSEKINQTDMDGGTVYATLVKCGLSTLEAVDELAKLLKTTKDKIQYAGIKDKDAITSQEISVRGISKENIEKVSSPYFFLKNIHTGKGVIQKGGLTGNHFTILLRMAENNDARINNALSALERIKHDGFYNFFYLQRFGSPRLNNYKWGISILKGDYEKAVISMISDPGIREIPFFLKKRKEMLDLMPNWPKVLEKLQEFPLIYPSEIKVVQHLIQRPDDFAGALQKIEEQVVLWVSAVASLAYNRKISAYLMANMEPPKSLPLFLSTDRNDWLPYEEDMSDVGIFPPNFNNLKPFRSISLTHKDIVTKDKVEVHGAEVIPEGLVVSFSLSKGQYATTFLSHFVNLLSGKIPQDIKDGEVDTKKILKESSSDTLNFFRPINLSKKETI